MSEHSGVPEAFPPVAIGGVGGSGTRLVAQCLMELGFFMGSDLNGSNDNLLFTLLFKHTDILDVNEDQFKVLAEIFLRCMLAERDYSKEQLAILDSLAATTRNKFSVAWLQGRVQALLNDRSRSKPEKWGWKEPSTHVVLPRLIENVSNLRYIHVVRNGLDMAYSSNQSQLELWGSYFIEEKVQNSPRLSLKYWCAVHRRILQIGDSLGPDFLWLNYDQFCRNRKAGVALLLSFLDIEPSGSVCDRIAPLIKAPTSIGRYKAHDLSVFDDEDVSFVRRLGFDTSMNK